MRAMLLALLFAGAACAQDFPFEQLHPTGTSPKANRIHVVFVSDGYDEAEDIDRYRLISSDLVKGLLASSPFQSYANFFTFTRIDAPTRPGPQQSAPTGGAGWNAVWAANPGLPRQAVVRIVNGWVPTAVAHGKYILLSEANAKEDLVAQLSRELGYVLGGLKDQSPEARAERRASGAHPACRMVNDSLDPFCPECAEALVKRLYAHVSLLEPWKPEDEVIQAGGAGQPVTVAAECLGPVPSTAVQGEWTLDGRMLNEKGTRTDGRFGPRFEIALDGESMTPGIHDVKLVVTDRTVTTPGTDADDSRNRRRPNVRRWAVRVPAAPGQITGLRPISSFVAQ